MEQSSIDKILASRRPTAAAPAADESDKFFSIMVGEGLQEHFLELKLRDGLRIALSYTDLSWFSFDPDGPKIDLEFGSIFVTIKGRGLGDRLFTGIKQKRVGWIQEASTEMQDHAGNQIFIEEISFVVPKNEEPES